MRIEIKDRTNIDLEALTSGVHTEVKSDHGDSVTLVALAEFKEHAVGTVYGSITPEHGLHCSNKVYCDDQIIAVSNVSVGGNFEYPDNEFTGGNTVRCSDPSLVAIHIFDTRLELLDFLIDNQPQITNNDFD